MSTTAYNGIFLAPESIVVYPGFDPAALSAHGEAARAPERFDAGAVCESRPTPACCK